MRRRWLVAMAWACGLGSAVGSAAPEGTAMDEQTVIEVERLGGFAGYGPGSRFRARGTLRWRQVPAAERERLAQWLDGRSLVPPVRGADRFRYRITVQVQGGVQSIELPEEDTPAVLRDSVRDEPR